MHDVTPHSIRFESKRKVVFTLDMTLPQNQVLRYEGTIRRSMAEFMLFYKTIEKYDAVYVENWVILSVTGKINERFINV